MKLQICEGFQNTKYIRLYTILKRSAVRYIVCLYYNPNCYTRGEVSRLFYTVEEAKEYIAAQPLEDGRPIRPPADNSLEKYLPA